MRGSCAGCTPQPTPPPAARQPPWRLTARTHPAGPAPPHRAAGCRRRCAATWLRCAPTTNARGTRTKSGGGSRTSERRGKGKAAGQPYVCPRRKVFGLVWRACKLTAHHDAAWRMRVQLPWRPQAKVKTGHSRGGRPNPPYKAQGKKKERDRSCCIACGALPHTWLSACRLSRTRHQELLCHTPAPRCAPPCDFAGTQTTGDDAPTL